VPAEPLHNEPALLDQVAQGDEKAFRVVFDHYRDTIYAFALKVTRRETIAEEIVQDVFIKIWINRSALPGVRHFGNFLYIIARNHTFNSLRTLAKEKLTGELPEQMEEAGASAESTVLQYDYGKLLQHAIAQLPPQQKLVYTLSRQHGLSREEIAGQLNISPGTVKAHMTQALRSIRDYFKTHESSVLWVVAALSLSR